MKYLLMIALMGFGSAAMADDTSINTTGEREWNNNVEFNCHFRGHKKKGEYCEVRGEVCIERDKKGGGRPGLTDEKKRKCESDNRIFVRCSNGFHESDRVSAELKRDDLVIKTENKRGGRDDLTNGRDEESIRLEIEDFDKDGRGGREDFDERRENDKDRFSSRLTVRDGVDFELWGTCRVKFDDDRKERPML